MDEIITQEVVFGDEPPLRPRDERRLPSEATASKPDELASYCRDLYEEYKDSDYRRRKLEEIEQSRKKYKGERDAKSFPWEGCSNKSLMIDAIVVDNLEPRIMAQLFGDPDFVDVEPVGAEDVQGAKAVKDFLSWALLQNMDINQQMCPVIHDLMIDGTAFVIPLWSEVNRKNYVREQVPMFIGMNGPIQIPIESIQTPQVQQMMQMGIIQYAGMEERITQKPILDFKVEVEQIPINDAFFPDTGDKWEDQPFLRMIYPTIDELRELSEENGGPYTNISDNLIMSQGRDSTDEKDTDAERKGVQVGEYTKECPILECHVKWEGEWMIVSFSPYSGWTEVRRQPMGEVFAHGRKQIKRFDIFRENNESMGTGYPAKIKHFSDGCDDIYNQMIDNGTLENMPFGTWEETIGASGMNFKLAPGAMIAFPKGANPQFPRFGGDSTRFLQFIEILLQMQERLVSLMNYTASGQINDGGAGSETFSGMSLLVNESNIRLNYTVEHIRNITSDMVKDILSLYGQYLPFDAKMRIMQDDQYVFQPFDLQAIQGQYDIKINVSSSSGNKMLKRKEANELYTLLGVRPESNPLKLIEDLLESYDVKDTSGYIKPEINMLSQALMMAPELPQVVQQYMAQKQEQMRIQGLQQQAQGNIERQAIQREAEAPHEGNKLVDQVTESAKRKLFTPLIEQNVAQKFLGGLR